jgi:hypothetical protein
MADDTERRLLVKADRPDVIRQELERVADNLPRGPFGGFDEQQRQMIERGLGVLELTSEMRAILEEPIPPEDLDILPTGEVYASQVQYRRRLTRVFGPGGWVMLELSQPTIKNNVVIQKWALFARSVFIASAWGEQEYFDNNPRMSYATALESAKSNALTRCCKDLSIASECWDRHYTEAFKREYCTEVIIQQYAGGGARKMWRRKDGEPFWQERQPQDRIGSGGAAQTGPATSLPPRSRSKSPAAPPPPSPKINPDLVGDLLKKIAEAESDPTAICEYYKVATLEDLSVDNYEHCMKTLNTKLLQMQRRGELKLD